MKRAILGAALLLLLAIPALAQAQMSPLAMRNARVQAWSAAIWTLPHERDTISTKRSVDNGPDACTRFDRYTIQCTVEESGTWTRWDHWTNSYDKNSEWCIANVQVHKDQYGIITERTLDKTCV